MTFFEIFAKSSQVFDRFFFSFRLLSIYVVLFENIRGGYVKNEIKKRLDIMAGEIFQKKHDFYGFFTFLWTFTFLTGHENDKTDPKVKKRKEL